MRNIAPTKDGRWKVVGPTQIPALAIKANRLSAGMAFTLANQVNPRGDHGRPASLLAVFGSTDVLRRGLGRLAQHNACPCCGAPARGKPTITHAGQLRLLELRRRREVRLPALISRHRGITVGQFLELVGDSMGMHDDV